MTRNRIGVVLWYAAWIIECLATLIFAIVTGPFWWLSFKLYDAANLFLRAPSKRDDFGWRPTPGRETPR